jgi:hypothetical protein
MHWSDIDFRPSKTALRQFAALATLFLLGIAGWQYFMHGRHLLSFALAAVGAIMAALGLVWPAGLRWLFVALTLATFPLGWLMSWLLMGSIYYLLFTPLAIYFRLIGRDALARCYDATVESYWIDKPQTTELRRYFRQF